MGQIADPTDVRSLAQIFKSGDLLLDNPAETCIIFVSVIIVSAGLEYLLQIIGRIENRYVRLIASTMTKELTIIGVLALILMLASSLVPVGESKQDRYSIIFTWAEMNLFFMAIFFVFVVLVQFLWTAIDQPRWRGFEEGRMDSEEAESLWYRERVYKRVYELYADELVVTFSLTPADCALHELLQVFSRRVLVKMSDLSWPVWVGLLPIILLNFARTYVPVEESNKYYTLYNGLLYIAATGYATTVAFLIFFAMLQHRLNDLLLKRVRRSTVGAQHLPFGSPKRCIGFLQCVVMCLNWYVSLFATGMGKDILTKAEGWQAAVMVIALVIPLVIVHALLPWCVTVLTHMMLLGSVPVHQSLIERIIRRHRGGGDDDDEDEDDIDSEEEKEIRKELEKRAAANKEAAARRAAAALTGPRGGKRPPGPPPGFKGKGVPPHIVAGKGPMTGGGGPKMPPPPAQRPVAQPTPPPDTSILVQARQRPGWMDSDEEWEGDDPTDPSPDAAGARAQRERQRRRAADPLFFEHLDESDLRDAMFRQNPQLRRAFQMERESAAQRSNRGRSLSVVSRGGDTDDPYGDYSVAGVGDDYEMDEAELAANDDPFDNTARPTWLESDEEW